MTCSPPLQHRPRGGRHRLILNAPGYAHSLDSPTTTRDLAVDAIASGCEFERAASPFQRPLRSPLAIVPHAVTVRAL